MKKTYTLFLLFFQLSFLALGQEGSIKGQATGGGSPLIAATVALLNSPDSSLVRGASSDVEGNFEMGAIRNGSYILKISYLGFNDLYRNVTISGSPVNLGTLTLSTTTTNLREVQVVGRAATAITRGDTTELNASAFKVNKDADAENLIQKMPGITVTNGQVQAQGERVQRVLVDGKEFFGEDPSAVLKNLPAEVISKIQVFDRQSDQSQFTGFSDGNEQKTINIITKPEFRTGQFGRISAGIGTDSRYRVSGNLNSFKGDQRISIVGLSNNVNEQNFSSEDLVGVASASSRGGGGGRGGRGGGGGNWGGGNSTGDFLVNANNGIANTNAIGINYLDKWGQKTDVQGSYFFNHSKNDYNYSAFRQFLRASENDLNIRETGNSDATNQNHRFNLRLTYKIDSANSIIIRPRLSVQTNDGLSITNSRLNSATGTIPAARLINNFDNTFNSELIGINFNNSILYRHSFAKRGRTISLDLTNGYNKNDGDSNQRNVYLNDVLNTEDDSLIAQNSNLNNQGYNVGANVEYTEPLTQNTQLQLSYNSNLVNSDGDRRTFQLRPITDQHDSLVVNQSSTVENRTLSNSLGAGWRYSTKDFQFMVRANYQMLRMDTDQLYPTTLDTTRKYHNILPFAMLRYNINQDRNIRVFYMGRTQIPSIDQLQSAIDISNPTLITQGNPNLGQSFTHNLNLRYSSANPEKSSSFFAFIGGSMAQDYIGRATARLADGRQISRPINLDGQYSLRSFLNFGLPLNFIKTNLNVNANANYSKNPSLFSDASTSFREIANDTKNTNLGAGIVLSSNISENLDFLVSTNANYNDVKYTYLTAQNNNYYNQSSLLRLNWIIWKGLTVTSELNHQYNGGLAEGIDPTYMLWNGGIGYKFMKDRQAEIRLSGFDLLGQNTSVQRNINNAYIEDVQTTVLQRYFMLSFNYNLRQFGGASAPAPSPGRPVGGPGGFRGN